MRRLLLAALLLAPPALGQEGRAAFEARCASCHAVAPGAPPMAGPNLHGLAGRRVGGAAGFDYSPVLEEAGRRGEVWDAARLDRFLADPEEEYPGVWMGANGARDARERAAIIGFLMMAR